MTDSSGGHLRSGEMFFQRSVWLIGQVLGHPKGNHQFLVIWCDLGCIALGVAEREQKMEHICSLAVLSFRYFVRDRRHDIVEAAKLG